LVIRDGRLIELNVQALVPGDRPRQRPQARSFRWPRKSAVSSRRCT